jgi:hypothetical protein
MDYGIMNWEEEGGTGASASKTKGAQFLNKPSSSCFNYTYIRREEKRQNHSLNTTLSVCKPATCFGYIQDHQAEQFFIVQGVSKRALQI